MQCLAKQQIAGNLAPSIVHLHSPPDDFGDTLKLQEDFLATVWDREGGGVPVPAEAPYNGPEAVPAFQNQNSVGLHPDYR